MPLLPTLSIPTGMLDISWIKDNVPSDIPIVSSAAVTIGLGAATAIGTYAYGTRNYSRWSKLGIENPPPVPFFGNMLPRFYKVVPDLEMEYLKTYGKIYGFYEMSRPVLIVAEPELIKNIMVRDFSSFMDRRTVGLTKITRHFLTQLKGEEWRRARNTITPAFTSGKMKTMMSLMDDCAESLVDAMDKRAKSGEDVDIKTVYGCYTMDVVAKCAFATETNAQVEGKKNPFVAHALGFVTPSRFRLLAFFMLPTFLMRNVVSHEHVNYLEMTVKQILDERRKHGYTRHYKDFLQVLMDSVKEEISNENNNSNGKVDDAEAHHGHEHINSNGVAADRKKNLSEDEVVANAIIFLIAGYETTATLLTYCTYALATNPEVQEKLRQECQEAYEAAGNRLDYETISTLKYLDSVICETLRIYPPVVRIERVVTEDYKLEVPVNGGTTVKLSVGDIVRFPVYAMHHSEEFYPNPESFQPERWMPENRDKLVPYTYLPFGAGPRNCIGMRFALLEAKLALMKLILQFRFVRSERTPAKADLSKAQILLSSKDLYVKVEKI